MASSTSAQRTTDSDRYKRIQKSGMYSALSSPPDGRKGDQKDPTPNVTPDSNNPALPASSISPRLPTSATPVFPSARGTILRAIVPDPASKATTKFSVAQLSSKNNVTKLMTPLTISPPQKQQAPRILSPSNARTPTTSLLGTTQNRNFSSKIPSSHQNKPVASPAGAVVATAATSPPALFPNSKSPLRVPLVMPASSKVVSTTSNLTKTTLSNPPDALVKPRPAMPSPSAPTTPTPATQQQEQTSKALLRPKLWNRDQLIEWLERKHLLASDQAAITDDIDGARVMRMTVAQLREVFFPNLEKSLSATQAAKLYKMLRVQDDIAARLEFKEAVRLKKLRAAS